MDKFIDGQAICQLGTDLQVHHNLRCISYFYREANAFSLAKQNLLFVYNLAFAETLFAIILSESKKRLVLLYPGGKVSTYLITSTFECMTCAF